MIPWPLKPPPSGRESGYAGYQLIRNVLAAYAQGCSFCVIHDQRRPDLREAWFEVMAAVKSAETAGAVEGAHLAGTGRDCCQGICRSFWIESTGLLRRGGWLRP